MTGGQEVTINSRKYDQSIRRSWTARLVETKGALLIFAGLFDRDVDHPDLGLINSGTVSWEYYWLDRWYSIFRFHDPDGRLRNYYCNINMPPVFTGIALEYVDLDIDVVVWPDLSYKVLDLDEFEANAAIFEYPEKVQSRASAALDEVVALIEKGRLPAR